MSRIIYRNYVWFDPGAETPLLLADIPKTVKSVSYDTLRSCALRGRENTLTGATVRLRVCRLPQGIGTTVEEYRRFLSAMNSIPPE